MLRVTCALRSIEIQPLYVHYFTRAVDVRHAPRTLCYLYACAHAFASAWPAQADKETGRQNYREMGGTAWQGDGGETQTHADMPLASLGPSISPAHAPPLPKHFTIHNISPP